jgi:hypothetical protein
MDGAIYADYNEVLELTNKIHESAGAILEKLPEDTEPSMPVILHNIVDVKSVKDVTQTITYKQLKGQYIKWKLSLESKKEELKFKNESSEEETVWFEIYNPNYIQVRERGRNRSVLGIPVKVYPQQKVSEISEKKIANKIIEIIKNHSEQVDEIYFKQEEGKPFYVFIVSPEKEDVRKIEKSVNQDAMNDDLLIELNNAVNIVYNGENLINIMPVYQNPLDSLKEWEQKLTVKFRSPKKRIK